MYVYILQKTNAWDTQADNTKVDRIVKNGPIIEFSLKFSKKFIRQNIFFKFSVIKGLLIK